MTNQAPTSTARGVRARVVQATLGRDRVLDAVKACALLAVVAGHSLAWHVSPSGSIGNVLETAPSLVWVSWLFQVLPLFFAAGAVSNMASWQRHGAAEFWRSRTRGLLSPILLYAAVWTVLLLPVAAATGQFAGGTVVTAGRFLSFLLWFAGVYLLVITAVPLTARWRTRPVLTLSVWFVVIVLVDVARIVGAPTWIGWCNLLLVWGWLHQWGYQLPLLRTQAAWKMIVAALIALSCSMAVAIFGPYSQSLITVAGDSELSNLSPPSVVLALYGVAQICVIGVLWRPLTQLFRHDAVWVPVAIVGARAMGIYLWHIPLVAVAALVAFACGMRAAPLTLWWWVVHVLVVVLVLVGAWLVAGFAGWVAARIDRVPGVWRAPPLLTSLTGGVVVLSICATGFGTWWGAGALGLPASALLNLALLIVVWQAVARRARARQRPPL